MTFTWGINKLFILAAIIIWLVVAIIDIAKGPVDHELAIVTIGLASFGLGFLLP